MTTDLIPAEAMEEILEAFIEKAKEENWVFMAGDQVGDLSVQLNENKGYISEDAEYGYAEKSFKQGDARDLMSANVFLKKFIAVEEDKLSESAKQQLREFKSQETLDSYEEEEE